MAGKSTEGRFELHLWLIVWSDSQSSAVSQAKLRLASQISSEGFFQDQNVATGKNPAERNYVPASNCTIIVVSRVAKCYVRIPKISIWVYFGRPRNDKCWLYFMAFKNISRSFNTFYEYLVYYEVIWFVIQIKIWQPHDS
jgi:hypothetical protein